MLKIEKNPDAAIYEEMTEAVKENDGYCPCAIVKNEDTRCPCRDFREQTTEGACHCGRFVKVPDLVEVVRCKDCAVPHNKWVGCPNLNGVIPPPDFYCARGERKEGQT